MELSTSQVGILSEKFQGFGDRNENAQSCFQQWILQHISHRFVRNWLRFLPKPRDIFEATSGLWILSTTVTSTQRVAQYTLGAILSVNNEGNQCAVLEDFWKLPWWLCHRIVMLHQECEESMFRFQVLRPIYEPPSTNEMLIAWFTFGLTCFSFSPFIQSGSL